MNHATAPRWPAHRIYAVFQLMVFAVALAIVIASPASSPQARWAGYAVFILMGLQMAIWPRQSALDPLGVRVAGILLVALPILTILF